MDLVVGLVLGLVLGAVVGASWAFRRAHTNYKALTDKLTELQEENRKLQLEKVGLEEKLRATEEKTQWLDQAKQELEAAFKALASDALRDNAEQLLQRARDALQTVLAEVKGDLGKNTEKLCGLVDPLKDQLTKLQEQVRDFENKRERVFGGLAEQLNQLARDHQALHQVTERLVQALRSPTARGRWGEVQLRRVVELAGLTRHVDFVEQVGTDRGRPDLIVKLPNGKELAVDAKAPLDAFWQALEARDDEQRREHLVRNAEKLLEHLRELGKKSYWESLSRATDLVVMFVPSEACVAAAYEVRPELLEEGWKNRVVVATPTVLFALLRTVAYVWQQQELLEEADRLTKDALQLYERFATFVEHFKRVGERLSEAVEAYNQAAGSARARLLPLAQRYAERIRKEFPEPPEVPRPTSFPN